MADWRIALNKLCFGTFATVLKLCSYDLSDAELVGAIVGTIDPNNRYDEEAPASLRLLNCEIDFSRNIRNSGASAHTDKQRQAISAIIQLAKTIDENIVSQNFAANIISRLDKDKRDIAIIALLYIIEADEDMAKKPHSFKEYYGAEKGELFRQNIELSSFLASTLLYVVNETRNKDGAKCIKDITAERINDVTVGITKNRCWNPETQTLELRNVGSIPLDTSDIPQGVTEPVEMLPWQIIGPKYKRLKEPEGSKEFYVSMLKHQERIFGPPNEPD